MPTVSAKISKKELDTIQEHANACGETVSNLIRKVVIGEAIFIHWANDAKEYGCEISISDNVSGDEETKIVQGTYNKIRNILGLDEIQI